MRILFPTRFRPLRHLSCLFVLTTLALLVAPTSALWPFPPKRFSGNALVAAGSLGLDDGDSRVIAFGDFNGDHLCVLPTLTRSEQRTNTTISVDIMTLASDQHTVSVYLWSHGEPSLYSNQLNINRV